MPINADHNHGIDPKFLSMPIIANNPKHLIRKQIICYLMTYETAHIFPISSTPKNLRMQWLHRFQFNRYQQFEVSINMGTYP